MSTNHHAYTPMDTVILCIGEVISGYSDGSYGRGHPLWIPSVAKRRISI